ncbi:MAG: methyltransferase [Thermodesulfobacteriota bacterium]|nr:methyltransferase [Thermodesulfobacteriota bacterium]
MDPVLLAGHVKIRGRESILDIGTGCGILLLLLLFRHPGISATGIEIQTELAEIAQKNLAFNHFQARSKILCQDIKKTDLSQIKRKPDIIVANPPYKKKNSGRISPDRQRTIARHETAMTLEDLAAAADRLLPRAGTAYFIYPAERTTDLVCTMNAFSISPVNLQFIYTGRVKCAKLVLFKGIKHAAAPLIVLPPFFTDTLNC